MICSKISVSRSPFRLSRSVFQDHIWRTTLISSKTGLFWQRGNRGAGTEETNNLTFFYWYRKSHMFHLRIFLDGLVGSPQSFCGMQWMSFAKVWEQLTYMILKIWTEGKHRTNSIGLVSTNLSKKHHFHILSWRSL